MEELKGMAAYKNNWLSTPGLKEFDRQVASWLHHQNSQQLDRYFTFFSLCGKQPTIFGLAIATGSYLWRQKQRRVALAVLGAVGGGWFLNHLAKRVVKRNRPLSVNSLLHHSHTYSFPSAHATLSLCYFGMLGWLGLHYFKKPASRFGWLSLMLFLVLMIGLSRVYREEHHATDILGGYLLSSLWLVVIISLAGNFKKQAELT